MLQQEQLRNISEPLLAYPTGDLPKINTMAEPHKFMKDFNWTSFTKNIVIRADIHVLYNAWTVAAEIERWFLRRALYFDKSGRALSLYQNVEAGDTYIWSWYAQNNVENGQILDANGKDLIQFTFAGKCTVEVKLTQMDNYVMVRLTQKDIPVDEESMQNIRLGCASAWLFYLVNLKSVYEGGLDLRNKYDTFINMVNS
jgi:uncharacterized protein YndB with AHSA1/START domain